MPDARRWLLALGLALVVAGLLMGRSGNEEQQPPIARTQGPELGAHARQVTLVTTAADGRRSWQLEADTALYYETMDAWLLTAPRWQIDTSSGPPWNGRAERGRVWADTTRADLTGNVVMERETAAGRTRLVTASLQMRLPEHFARTDDPVTLTGPDYRVESIGARAWLREERIELLNQVRGRYALDDS